MYQYVVGAAAGYVLGTKAGRKRYHQIVNAAQAVANSPVTKQVTASARRAIANKIDPEPRMREVKDLRKGKKLRGKSDKQIEDTIYDVMLDSQVSVHSAIVHTGVAGLDLVPANIDLSAAEIQMVNEVGREHTLARALRPVRKDYDFIIIDCQPSLGLLTVNALACSQGVIIPMECEFFSLRGLALLTDTVEKVADRINFDLEVMGILVTMFDRRTRHAREVMDRVVEYFGDKVFDTVITRTVRFPETSVAGEPITTWAPSSQAAKQYRDLAKEVIERATV